MAFGVSQKVNFRTKADGRDGKEEKEQRRLLLPMESLKEE